MLAGAFVLHGQMKHPSSHLIERPSDALISKFDERGNDMLLPITTFVLHVVKFGMLSCHLFSQNVVLVCPLKKQ
jgi:hypothetical protein